MMNQFHFHPATHTRVGSLVAIFLFAPVLMAAAILADSEERLVVYSGRAERLIKPVLDAFQAKTGITVELLSSGTTELVNRLQAEGERTPADVLFTNDAGSLERARELGLLLPLVMPTVEEAVPPAYRAHDNSWIGLSGRFWILVYNTTMVNPTDLKSILELADPKWMGKIGIPNAGSEYLQAGASVIKAVYGEDRTRRFLEGLKVNAGTHVYGKSSQIVEAVAKGQVPIGLVNHYYIYRYLAEHPKTPIAPLMLDQHSEGMGAIMNVAGVAITKQSRRVEAAKRLIAFLVSREGQKMFADLNKEYPVRTDVPADPTLPERGTIRTAAVALGNLARLREPTMTLIEQAGLR
jgi:iron(III) transport system substrate-binding protein